MWTRTTFRGTIDVSGTIDEPQIARRNRHAGRTFRAIRQVSRSVFGRDRPLGGRCALWKAIALQSITCAVVSCEQRKCRRGHQQPAIGQRDVRAARREARNPEAQPPRLAGEFTLNGNVNLDPGRAQPCAAAGEHGGPSITTWR
jgi:hypothetical protein